MYRIIQFLYSYKKSKNRQSNALYCLGYVLRTAKAYEDMVLNTTFRTVVTSEKEGGNLWCLPCFTQHLSNAFFFFFFKAVVVNPLYFILF